MMAEATVVQLLAEERTRPTLLSEFKRRYMMESRRRLRSFSSAALLVIVILVRLYVL